jgi:hypothetical protein
MKQFLLRTFPYSVFCQTCHTLFPGGHDLQNIDVPVDVSSPDGNFDNPKNLVGKPYEIQNQSFDFCTPQALNLYTRSIFLRWGHLKKYGVKNYFP